MIWNQEKAVELSSTEMSFSQNQVANTTRTKAPYMQVANKLVLHIMVETGH